MRPAFSSHALCYGIRVYCGACAGASAITFGDTGSRNGRLQVVTNDEVLGANTAICFFKGHGLDPNCQQQHAERTMCTPCSKNGRCNNVSGMGSVRSTKTTDSSDVQSLCDMLDSWEPLEKKHACNTYMHPQCACRPAGTCEITHALHPKALACTICSTQDMGAHRGAGSERHGTWHDAGQRAACCSTWHGAGSEGHAAAHGLALSSGWRSCKWHSAGARRRRGAPGPCLHHH